jgi:hypothetical protein
MHPRSLPLSPLLDLRRHHRRVRSREIFFVTPCSHSCPPPPPLFLFLTVVRFHVPLASPSVFIIVLYPPSLCPLFVYFIPSPILVALHLTPPPHLPCPLFVHLSPFIPHHTIHFPLWTCLVGYHTSPFKTFSPRTQFLPPPPRKVQDPYPFYLLFNCILLLIWVPGVRWDSLSSLWVRLSGNGC